MKTSSKTVCLGLLGIALLGLSVRADGEGPVRLTVDFCHIQVRGVYGA